MAIRLRRQYPDRKGECVLKQTMRAIIKFGKENGEFPTGKQLAEILNKSYSTVTYRKYQLKKLGLIEVNESEIVLYPEKVGLNEQGE